MGPGRGYGGHPRRVVRRLPIHGGGATPLQRSPGWGELVGGSVGGGRLREGERVRGLALVRVLTCCLPQKGVSGGNA